LEETPGGTGAVDGGESSGLFAGTFGSVETHRTIFTLSSFVEGDIWVLFFSPPEPTTGDHNSLSYPDPNLGDPKHGQGHDNGFCHQNTGVCLNVRGLLTHYDEAIVDSGSTQVFTFLVSCPRGANTCDHMAFGAGLPGSDVYDDRWTVTVDRVVGTDDWVLTVYNPFGEIVEDEVVVTVQQIDNTFITGTWNVVVSIAGSFGTPIDDGVPADQNRHLHFTVSDSNGGVSNYIFNEGISVNDIDAYPQIESSFDESLEYDQICVNENINKRYSCAFDKVRDWTIKNAEKTLSEMS